jgi:hypothetical protein
MHELNLLEPVTRVVCDVQFYLLLSRLDRLCARDHIARCILGSAGPERLPRVAAPVELRSRHALSCVSCCIEPKPVDVSVRDTKVELSMLS